MTGRNTFLEKLEEFKRKYGGIDSLLSELEELVPIFLTEDGVINMFEKDKEQIIKNYEEGFLSRQIALVLLNELMKTASELGMLIEEITGRLMDLETRTQYVTKWAHGDYQRGVPIYQVVEKIRNSLDTVIKDLPKKDFETVDLSKIPGEGCTNAVENFLAECLSGILVAQPEFKECIVKTLRGHGKQFEIKEMGSRIVFIVEGSQ